MARVVEFVTGNKRKVWQAEQVLNKFDISVQPLLLDIDEIQSHDPELISIAKAKTAFALHKKPLIICDHYWSIPALNGFPGGYMKDINMWFSAGDWLALMRDKADRRAVLTETIIYIDGDKLQTFEAEFKGRFVDKPRGKGNVSCEQVVAFDGSDKTIAEHIDMGEHARDMSESAWKKFGKWYAER